MQRVKFFTWKWREIITGTSRKSQLVKQGMVIEICISLCFEYLISLEIELNFRVAYCVYKVNHFGIHSLKSLFYSGCWRLAESIPGCFWDKQIQDAAYTSNQAGSSPQLFCILLWNPQLPWQSMSACQTGLSLHSICLIMMAVHSRLPTCSAVLILGIIFFFTVNWKNDTLSVIF
jgi:hypothetical protein